MDEAPYFLVRREGPKLVISGRAEMSLGSSLDAGIRWRWDGEQLEITTDRFGMYPLYYFADKDKFAVSSSLPRLISLGAPTEIDDRAVAVFCFFGSFIGEDTPFKSVRATPPGGNVVWRDGELSVNGGYSNPERNDLPRAQAVRRYTELFAGAIERRRPRTDNFVLPLTGGRDSRHILFELLRQGYPPKTAVTAINFPPGGHPDAIVAKQLCDATSVQFTTVGHSLPRFEAELEKNESVNFCSFEHIFSTPLVDHLRVRSFDGLFDGIGGDVLSAGLFLTEATIELAERGDANNLAKLLLNGTPRSSGYLQPEYRERFGFDVALEHMKTELLRHMDAPDPVTSFHFWNRTRRNISLVPFGLFSQEVDVHAPYIDEDVFDFLASQPAGLFASHSFHSEVIQTAYPEYDSIPYAASDPFEKLPRGFRRGMALSVLRALCSSRSQRFLSLSFCMSRWARMVVQPRNDDMTVDWFFRPVCYFLSLQKLIERGQ